VTATFRVQDIDNGRFSFREDPATHGPEPSFIVSLGPTGNLAKEPWVTDKDFFKVTIYRGDGQKHTEKVVRKGMLNILVSNDITDPELTADRNNPGEMVLRLPAQGLKVRGVALLRF
jgi:hypothetical protein